MGDKIRPAFARSIPVTSCHGERSRPSARRLFAGCAEPLSVGIRAAVRRLRIDDPFRLARHLGSTRRIWILARLVCRGHRVGGRSADRNRAVYPRCGVRCLGRNGWSPTSGCINRMHCGRSAVHRTAMAELRRYCSASASSCWCSPVVGSTQLMLDALSLHKAGQATQASIVAGRQGTSL